MRKLVNSLADHPRPLLQAIARLYGLEYESETNRFILAQQVAAAINSPAGWEETKRLCSPAAWSALLALQSRGGRIPEVLFRRQYGEIRPLGGAKLWQVRPWRAPISPAEELWYRGLIFRAFDRQAGRLIAFIYTPPEIRSLLPPSPKKEIRLPTLPDPAQPFDERRAFWLDMVTLLVYMQQKGSIPLTKNSARPEKSALLELNERLQTVWAGEALIGERLPPRLSLLFYVLHRLRLWRRSEDSWRLGRGKVLLSWLKEDSRVQRWSIWRAWRDGNWHDLCHVPWLRCVAQPHPVSIVVARRRFLQALNAWSEDAWHRIADVVRVFSESEPDFLRPAADFDFPIVRRGPDGELLRGVAHWDDVEGSLIRFYLCGPLAWLGAVQLSRPWQQCSQHNLFDRKNNKLFAETDDTLWQWRPRGRHWLAGDVQPAATTRTNQIDISPEGEITLFASATARTHFRVGRFTRWIASDPWPRYQITEQQLQRAVRQGLRTADIYGFLMAASSGRVPAEVHQMLRAVS